MLALLLTVVSLAADPIDPAPSCDVVVVERVSAAAVDRAELVPVDDRGVRRGPVVPASDEAALSLPEAPARVARR